MVRYLTAHQYADDYAARPAVDDRDVATVIPHKALRRVADHLLDHLTEIECRLAGQPTVPDQWHGRMVTTSADFARFTEVDLDEATSRLTRLAACYQSRLGGLSPDILDARPDDAAWTIREVAHHVSHVTVYADMVGRL